MDCNMVIVRNKGDRVTFIQVYDNHLYLNYVLFVFIIYFQQVTALFTPSIKYGRSLWVHLEICDSPKKYKK